MKFKNRLSIMLIAISTMFISVQAYANIDEPKVVENKKNEEVEFYKLDGFRAESIVDDPRKDMTTSIIYNDNFKEEVIFEHKLFYYNGELISNTEIISIEGVSYINIDSIENLIDYEIFYSVDKTAFVKDNKSVLSTKHYKSQDGKRFVSIREVFEKLGMNIEYYGISNRKSESLVPTRVSIYVDENYSGYTEIDKALENSKEVALEGLAKFEVSLQNNLENSGEPPNRFDKDIELIEKSINEMSYIGEISRYYIFDMNRYRVIYDKVSDEVYLSYNIGLATHTKILDINDSGLYILLFIVG